jgi:hypothetical protein
MEPILTNKEGPRVRGPIRPIEIAAASQKCRRMLLKIYLTPDEFGIYLLPWTAGSSLRLCIAGALGAAMKQANQRK